MTVWVIRDGQLALKCRQCNAENRADFPTPNVSRIEPFESPITGKEITSWGERDRDMKAVDAYDPRDLPKNHKFTNRERRDANPDPTVIGKWRDPG